MKIKQDQIILDLQENNRVLVIDNLNLKKEVSLLRNDLIQLQLASENVIVYYHAIDHRYEQFKRKVIKLKHLIK